MPVQLANESILWHLRCLELILCATTLSLIYFAIRAHLIGRELQRFTDAVQTEIHDFMERNASWSTVVHTALQTVPDLLDGGLRVLLSLQELTHQINRAGGLARLFNDAGSKRTPPADQSKPTTHNPRTRKPRATKATAQPDPQQTSISDTEEGN